MSLLEVVFFLNINNQQQQHQQNFKTVWRQTHLSQLAEKLPSVENENIYEKPEKSIPKVATIRRRRISSRRIPVMNYLLLNRQRIP